MEFDVRDYNSLTEEIGGRGPVTCEEARRLRLEYAARLEQDVFEEVY